MTDAQLKADLDGRELVWFKEHRGWTPPEGADIDRWLGDMREQDEALCDKGHFPACHLEYVYQLRCAVDKINELRKLNGLEPLTEEQAM